MKRWAVILLSFTMLVCIGKNVRAAEQINIYEDELPLTDARVVLNFRGQSSQTEYLEDDSIPVENVKIELYLKYKGELYNIKDLDVFKYTNHNLTSDENGKIIITNIPYGLYYYEVVSMPSGYQLNQELVEIEVTPMEKYSDLYIILKMDVAVGGNYVEIEEPKVEEETNKENENTTLPEEPEKVEEKNKDKEVEKEEEVVKVSSIKNLNVNTFTMDIYTYTKPNYVAKNEEEKILQQVSKKINENAKLSKLDMIKVLKQYKLTDMIKIAVLDTNKPSITKDKVVAVLDKDKKHKIKTLPKERITKEKFKKYQSRMHTQIKQIALKRA